MLIRTAVLKDFVILVHSELLATSRSLCSNISEFFVFKLWRASLVLFEILSDDLEAGAVYSAYCLALR